MPKKTDLESISELIEAIKETGEAQLANMQDMVERMVSIEERQGKLEKLYRLEDLKKYLKQVDDLTDVEIEKRDAKIRDAVAETINEMRETAKKSQAFLQSQVIRSSTLTEVLRFINLEAPLHLMRATQVLLTMHDKSDKWWNKNAYLRVWQWAALLVPEYRKKWEAKYGKALDDEIIEDAKLSKEEKKHPKKEIDPVQTELDLEHKESDDE